MIVTNYKTMKNKGYKLSKNSILFTVLSAIIVLSGCGLGKMVKKHEEVKYTVTPEILEVHGNKIPVSVNVTYPEKYFHKKATVEVAPYLKGANGEEVAMKPAKLIGETVEGDGTKISYTSGGSFSYTDTVPYTAALKQSQFMVKATASMGSKSEELGDMQLAEGCIITSTRAKKDETVLIGQDNYQKKTILSQSATLYFNIQNASVRSSEKYGKEMKALKEFVKKGYEGESVNISAYASPDGPLDLNEGLADKRQKNAQSYIQGELKRYKFDGATADSTYKQTATSEDWAGFQKALSESDMEDKEIVMKILNSYSDPVAREKEIKNLSSAYGKLRNTILPKLRRTEVTVNVLEPKLTDSVILAWSLANPDTLKQEELGYAATLTENKADQLKIYQSYSKIYPDDWRGPNNEAYVHIMNGENYNDAKALLEKANGLKENNAVVLNNLGALYARMGDLEMAIDYHNQASSAGADNGYNIGTYHLKMADYEKAKTFYGSDACGANPGLAYLLSGDNDNADRALGCAEEMDATTHYLKAVVAARTDDKTAMVDNLKKATSMNASYKEDAKTDLEFKAFWNDSDFQSAVQ